jgi:hypothetical protein
LKHAPLRRLLSWRPSKRRTQQISGNERSTGEERDQPSSLRPHDPADLGRAAATDREAIEKRLGGRRRRKR